MVDIQCAAAEIRRGKKKIEEDRKKPQDENIMVCPIPYGEHINDAFDGKSSLACRKPAQVILQRFTFSFLMLSVGDSSGNWIYKTCYNHPQIFF